MAPREFRTHSAEETEALGRRFGAAAVGGELIGLVGELGAGKTCLVRGLAGGLGADPDLVHSPTFTIHTRYRGRLILEHVDLYRLEGGLDDELSLRDVLYGPGVAAVEWFERLLPVAGDEFLVVNLRYTGRDERIIRCEAHGTRHGRLLAALGHE